MRATLSVWARGVALSALCAGCSTQPLASEHRSTTSADDAASGAQGDAVQSGDPDQEALGLTFTLSCKPGKVCKVYPAGWLKESIASKKNGRVYLFAPTVFPNQYTDQQARDLYFFIPDELRADFPARKGGYGFGAISYSIDNKAPQGERLRLVDAF